MTRLSFKLAL